MILQHTKWSRMMIKSKYRPLSPFRWCHIRNGNIYLCLNYRLNVSIMSIRCVYWIWFQLIQDFHRWDEKINNAKLELLLFNGLLLLQLQTFASSKQTSNAHVVFRNKSPSHMRSLYICTEKYYHNYYVVLVFYCDIPTAFSGGITLLIHR